MPPKAAKFAGDVNRNTLHKTLFDETVTDEATLLENFDACTPDQLAQLRRASCWTNPDKCPPDLIPLLQSQLLEKPNRVTVFERRRHEVLPLLLYKQFDRASSRFTRGQVPADLLHNFRRDSPSFTRLFEWGPYETVQRILGPVHFNIHVKQGHADSMHRLLGKQVKITSLLELQNALILSHSRPVDVACSDLIRHIENYLNATLQQVKVRENRLLFIFEWSEAPQFDYALCFDMANTSSSSSLMEVDEDSQTTMTTTTTTTKKKRGKKKRTLIVAEEQGEQILTMGRDDLLDGLNATGSEKCVISDTRERVRDARLRYFFNAFIRRDE